jgi:nicotinate-nucleotide--dimethylbenzimidazole phosphoribosyltransferase
MNITAAKSFAQTAAHNHYCQLTMPPSALERAFHPVLRILAQKGNNAAKPFNIKYAAAVFAGDHSVARLHGVSAFPPEVTGQMVQNFVLGGAAMSALCRRRAAPLYVVDVGVAYPYSKPSTTASNTIFFERNVATGQIGHEKYPTGATHLSHLMWARASWQSSRSTERV